MDGRRSLRFCNALGRDAVKVLDRPGLQAWEREVGALGEREERPDHTRNYVCIHWGEALRAIYSQQRDIEKYLELTSQTQLTQADCGAIAAMFQAKRKPNDALAWVERGLKIEKPRTYQGGASYKLAEMRRALLTKLSRGDEALNSAWVEFQEHPSKFKYEELIRYVPNAERVAWQDKAMVASEKGDLSSLIELWLSAKEIERLAERLNRATDVQLESLSHYVTEPAAERLAKMHPGVAAKVFCALGMRIVGQEHVLS